jgi:hypothetical protein
VISPTFIPESEGAGGAAGDVVDGGDGVELFLGVIFVVVGEEVGAVKVTDIDLYGVAPEKLARLTVLGSATVDLRLNEPWPDESVEIVDEDSMFPLPLTSITPPLMFTPVCIAVPYPLLAQ